MIAVGNYVAARGLGDSGSLLPMGVLLLGFIGVAVVWGMSQTKQMRAR